MAPVEDERGTEDAAANVVPVSAVAPPELQSCASAASVRVSFQRGDLPDTHRFLRMIQKVAAGLDAEVPQRVADAVEGLFAIPPWMVRINQESGLDLWVSRAYCALVVLFHRRGSCAEAGRAYDQLLSRNDDVPVCTLALLVDLSIRHGDYEKASNLLDQARTAAEKVIARARSGQQDSNEARCDGFKGGGLLATEGLPSWFSGREGHLVAVTCAHALAVEACYISAVCSGLTTKEGIARLAASTELAARALPEGLKILHAAVEAGAAGHAKGMEQRTQVAHRLLIGPCDRLAALCQDAGSAAPGAAETLIAETLIAETQAAANVRHAQAPPTPATCGAFEKARALQSVLGCVRRAHDRGQRVVRDHLDETLRRMGRYRSGTQGDVILAAFDAISVLAKEGSAPLEAQYQEAAAVVAQHKEADKQEEQGDDEVGDTCLRPRADSELEAGRARVDSNFVSDPYGEETPNAWKCDRDAQDDADQENVFAEGNGFEPERTPSSKNESKIDVMTKGSPMNEPPNPHLTPDADMFAAAIESLFGARDSGSAETLYNRCCRELLPNPAVFSAMIFGRLGCRDGSGAVQALNDMAESGFPPHARFLARFLRLCGRWHEQGLLAIEQHSKGFPAGARHNLFHSLIEACAAGSEPGKRAECVYQALLADGHKPNSETHFAVLKAVCGEHEEQQAVQENERLQRQGILIEHPGFEAVLLECYENGERRRRASGIMDSRRSWTRRALESLGPGDLEELRNCCTQLEASTDKGTRLIRAYFKALPLDSAGVHAAQFLVAKYYLLRSGEDKAALQAELDSVVAEYSKGYESEPSKRTIDAFALAIRIVYGLRGLEVPEGAQVRIVRMVYGAAQRAGASFRRDHGEYIEKNAEKLLPEVLSEVLEQCSQVKARDLCFGGEQGHQKLAHLAERRYLGRSGEPVKLSVAIRFVRAHGLAQHMRDETLFNPILGALRSGQVQQADSLCDADPTLRCRLVAYAISMGERRFAGRLAERFSILVPNSGQLAVPPRWSEDSFCAECTACVSLAEEAEEQELRMANEKRIAVDNDAGCLQLPSAVAAGILLVDSEETLKEACEVFARCLGVGSTSDRKLGLDVEWRPLLEKRGGMQKHRRSSKAAREEPCSTLQAATENFVAIFDLLALVHAEASAGLASKFSNLIEGLLGDPGVLKLGFGFKQDLQRLAASYPKLPCFQRVDNVIDVQQAAFSSAGNEANLPCGLSALCARHLGAPLSKRLQTSDWGARPLSREQLLYAGLDAHCLLGLSRALPNCKSACRTLEVRLSASGQLIAHVLSEDNPDKIAEQEIDEVEGQIVSKGAEIKAMKKANAAKAAVQAEVAVLLQLKDRFQELTGVSWTPPAAPAPV